MKPRTYIALVLTLAATLFIGAAAPLTRSRNLDSKSERGVRIELAEIGGCEYVIAHGRLTGYYGPTGVAITHHAAYQNPLHTK